VQYPLSLALYTGTREFLSYAYSPLLQGFGGDLVERPGMARSRGVLDGPQSVAAMKHLQHWFEQGWTQAVMNRNDDFEQGRTALVWSGHWRYRDFSKALGNDLVLLPLPDFGKGIKTGMGSWAWSMSSTCNEPAGAWAFIAHMLSPREVQRITEAIGAMPARNAVLASSRLYGRSGPLAVYAEQLRRGKGVARPQTPAYATISQEFSTAMSAIVAGDDVQAALGRAAKAIDEDIAAHRGYRP
jgi:multiple sugar transport system substrate-binding protein